MTLNIVQVIDGESFLAATSVSRETISRLETYETLLRKWQKSINLVSNASLDEIWSRHFWDSAQIAPISPKNAQIWLDFGSGAGFPGLILAILLRDRPNFTMHLVESDQRKAGFLREAARLTGAPAVIHAARIENLDLPDKPDVISARALAPLNQIFAWAEPFWGKDTIGLFPKGRGAMDELTEARKGWIFNHEAISSRSDPTGMVLRIWELRNAKPRHAG